MEAKKKVPTTETRKQGKYTKNYNKSYYQPQRFNDKALPSDIELEKIVIGSTLQYERLLKKVLDFLKPEMFYSEQHKLIFKTIISLYEQGKTADIVNTPRQLDEKELKLVGGVTYLMELTNVNAREDIEQQARIIQQFYLQRELIRISSQVTQQSFETTADPLQILETLRAQLDNLTEQLKASKNETKESLAPSLPFPLEVLPEFIQHFIKEVNASENFSIDFMAVAFMSAYAGLVGNKLKLRFSPTWITSPIFWFIIVGAPGSKKSHPVKLMLKPLKRIDAKRREIYNEEKEEFDNYFQLDKSERVGMESPAKPIDRQILIKNTTTEALFYAHKSNPSGLLYYRDEIEAWVRSMDQYKGGKGDDMANWLSLYDGDDLNINRVTKDRLVLDETNVNLIGTTQPARISNIPSTNGLIHRLLFTSADNTINNLNFETNITDDMLKKYNDSMDKVFEYYDGMEAPKIYTMTTEAQEISKEIDSYLVAVQKSDETTPIIKEYCEKLKTYIPRFEVLLADAEGMFNSDVWGAQITKKAANDTFKLIKYFLQNATIIFNDQKRRKVNKAIMSQEKVNEIKQTALLIKAGRSYKEIEQELGINPKRVYRNKIKAIGMNLLQS